MDVLIVRYESMKLLQILFLLLLLLNSVFADAYVLEKHMEAGIRRFFDILSIEKPLDKVEGLPAVEEFAAQTLEVWKKDLKFPKHMEAKLWRDEPVRTQAEFNAHVMKCLHTPEMARLRKAFSDYFSDKDVAEAEKEVVFTMLIYIVPKEPKIPEQDGTVQPTTRPESKPEGSQKPQPESEERPR